VAVIRVLEDSIANKIAAGEVVERTSSVVKELVENSLDAGASRVTVELMGAGRDLIRVVDDGQGMSEEDARLSILPHATSKIATLEDLAEIGTFGFRGEALPSIAAVSHFVLITRRHEDDAGTMIATEGGASPRVEPVGCPEGTSVGVRHLFFNTPPRLKFLKQNRTELARCVDCVSAFAMAFPKVGFQVLHEKEEVFRADPSDGLKSRLAMVLGRKQAKALIPFEASPPLARVYGATSDLSLHKPNRRDQYVFVNGRSVRSPVISQAISRAYEGLLPHGRHPVVVLFLEMDPRLVDPNVHPTKQEVRFPREGDIFRLVYGAIREELLAADLIPEASLRDSDPRPEPAEPTREPAPKVDSRPEAQRRMKLEPRPEAATEENMQAFDRALERRRAESAEEPQPPEAPPKPTPATESPGDAPPRVVGQAMDSYIIAEWGGELWLIDQHAAHERVLYERFMRADGDREIPTQGLLTPVTIEVSATEGALLKENLTTLAALGLTVEPFGKGAYIIRAVPAMKRLGDPERFLRGILADLMDDESEFASLRDRKQRLCATAACKAAVKQGDPLTPAEMEALVRDLRASENRFTCPHSRPATVRLGSQDLERFFHRR
jgi:DNA mismatch repair protein MutL